MIRRYTTHYVHFVLQCVAVCCRVLQGDAGWCSVMQRDAVCLSVLHYVALCCAVLHCAALCCTVLRCFALCCTVLHCVALCYTVLQCVAVWESSLTDVAVSHTCQLHTWCSVLQCVWVCCTVLHSEIHCWLVLLSLTHASYIHNAVCLSVLQCVAVCCTVRFIADWCCCLSHMSLTHVSITYLSHMSLTHASYIYRKEVVELEKFSADKTFGEDLNWIVRVMAHDVKVHHFPDTTGLCLHVQVSHLPSPTFPSAPPWPLRLLYKTLRSFI